MMHEPPGVLVDHRHVPDHRYSVVPLRDLDAKLIRSLADVVIFRVLRLDLVLVLAYLEVAVALLLQPLQQQVVLGKDRVGVEAVRPPRPIRPVERHRVPVAPRGDQPGRRDRRPDVVPYRMVLRVVRVERPRHLDDEPPVPVDGRVREVPALAVVCDRRGELVDHVRVGQDARGRLVDRHVRAAHAPRLAEAEADPPLRSDGHGEGRRAVPVPAFVFVDRPEDRRAVAPVVGSRGGEEAVAGVAAGRLREPRRVGGLLLGAEGGEVRAPAVAEGEGRQEEGEDELFATDHHFTVQAFV
mmetsp:Transcript_2838/g.5696  ORF Transcript_2838/g.5696 Transcript_2838/m.5696 type:complete len:298 (-) Transcript_2838:70-963(-)